jgi:hypothetical protein
MRISALVLLSFLLGALPAHAQGSAYQPRYERPDGREVIMVYIGKWNCGFSRDAQLGAAIRDVKPLLAARADSAGYSFAVRGVALDWKVEQGLAYLQTLGAFDEVSAGRNWFNGAAVELIWHGGVAEPAVPQVLLLERTIRPAEGSFVVGPDRVLARYVGVDEILAWTSAGAVVPR